LIHDASSRLFSKKRDEKEIDRRIVMENEKESNKIEFNIVFELRK